MKIQLTLLIPLIVSLSLILNKATATAQAPDILIYKGKKYKLYTNPLESYFNEDERPNDLLSVGCMTTACWRGYVGVWKLIDDKLYLIEIRSCCYKEDKQKADLKEIFGEKYSEKDGKLLADWFSGSLYIPTGKMLYYQHAAYESIHEKEIILKLKKGQVIESKKYDNSKTRLTYINDNNRLTKIVIQGLDEEMLKEWDYELKAYIKINSKDGIVRSIEIMKSSHPELNDEISKIIEAIKDFDILYRHGVEIESPWIFPVIINQERIQALK